MPEPVCEKCGSEIYAGVRFCRKCGHPTGMLEDASTRLLDSTPPIGAPTTVLNSGATKPAYLEPESKPSQPVAPSQPIKQAPSAPINMVPPMQTMPPPPPLMSQAPVAKKSGGLLIFLIGGFILVIAIVACVVIWKMSTSATTSESQSSPSTPQAPAAPTTPTTPTPPSNGTSGGEKGSLAYPGARTAMSGAEKGQSFTEYTTKDPVDKVAEWYKSKMVSPKMTSIMGTTTLTSGNTTVVITGVTGETTIMVAQK